MIASPVLFPFLVIGMLLMYMVFLANSELVFGGLFLGIPFLLMGMAGITYIYSATERLWKLIPLPKEGKQTE